MSAANIFAQQAGLTTFHQKLSAFQNNDVPSSVAQNYFDDYFGWMNPANFDGNGNVIGQA